MARKYGAPYIGSKNNIAEKIIDFLPAGRRLCDLFGGGGAISHCALTYGRNKFGSVLYNDYDPMVVDYVKDAFGGKFDIDKNVPNIVTREDFKALRTKRGDVAFLWSFGNNGIDYLWSKEKEELKLSAFAMLTRATVSERYKYYKRFMRALRDCDTESKSDVIEAIERMQPIESVQSIERLKPEQIQFTNMSYSDYEYSDGDVVYCDIPYENGQAKARYAKFDHKSFYDWAYSRPYPVYISSYGISDTRFKGVPISRRRQLLSKTSDDARVEMIYMNAAAEKEKGQEMLLF